MKIDPHQITLVDPTLLSVHPVARDLPGLADDDSDFEALVDNIRDHGVLYPIDIDSRNQILDGRHRWRAAKRLNMPAIPAVVRRDSEAIGIVLESLLLRRHYTKGALAYSAYPMLRSAYEEARDGRVGHSVADPSKATRYSVADPFTVEDQAARFGISRALYNFAGQLREIFSKDNDYKEFAEPKILAGEIGLGAAIAGYAGRKATKGKPKKVDSFRLFARTWTDLSNRFEYWEKFEPEQKRMATLDIDKAVEAMPADLLNTVYRRLSIAMKQRKTEE